jgi:pyridoxamine 5'-phosphate oxidase
MKHPPFGMDERHLADDPLEQLRTWLDDAREAVAQPDAMTLATSDPDGRPSARVVLLRGLDDRGITFFTNRSSRKGGELEHNPNAAAVLHWWELGRQVRIEGAVEQTTDEESAAYWQSRPRSSQLAAWASPQSQRLSGRDELDIRVAEAEERFAGVDVPLPPFWGGFRLVPATVEFWTHRDDRLHDRVRYLREPDGWRRERLAPLTSRAPRARRSCTSPRDSRACSPWRRTLARRRSAL